ncbi:MAG TPA: monofunctional biosynthetic peptidoglycan transglycosylase [Acidobacteriota bacterium]
MQKTARARKRKGTRWFTWRRALLFSVLVVLAATTAAVWWWYTPPSLQAWKSGEPSETWSVWDRQVESWRQQGASREVSFEYRPLSRISIDVQLAVLVGEDINFFGHQGIDFDAVREAVDEWRGGGRLRGASTISQQLAKNLFLSNERSWTRKLREAKLTWWIERELGKPRILELYLNVIEFDAGILGVGAAARRFYGKGAEALTAEEAAGLAAAIPAPHVSNPRTATRAWQNRREIIVQRMDDASWLRRRLASLRDAM